MSFPPHSHPPAIALPRGWVNIPKWMDFRKSFKQPLTTQEISEYLAETMKKGCGGETLTTSFFNSALLFIFYCLLFKKIVWSHQVNLKRLNLRKWVGIWILESCILYPIDNWNEHRTVTSMKSYLSSILWSPSIWMSQNNSAALDCKHWILQQFLNNRFANTAHLSISALALFIELCSPKQWRGWMKIW